MPSKYFTNYQTAIESSLIEDLYNEAIKIQGFSGYYLSNDNEKARDLIYGDDPLKVFKKYYILDMYLVNTMDYGDEQDFFSKFGLEVRNNIKIQFTAREFANKLANKYPRPREGDLIFIPFMKDTGELFEIKFVNTSKDLYTLGRPKPYYYEISLEPFKYNDENIQTGIDDIDIIDDIFAYKTTLQLIKGSGNFIKEESVIQIQPDLSATGNVISWDPDNLVLTLINVKGDFSNTLSSNVVGTISLSEYTLKSDTDDIQTIPFDNSNIDKEFSSILNPSSTNEFGNIFDNFNLNN